MTQSYSLDLRVRVVAFVDANHSCRGILVKTDATVEPLAVAKPSCAPMSRPREQKGAEPAGLGPLARGLLDQDPPQDRL
jgi:hypothetical protein